MKIYNTPEIYFHVGMGKAASTFLQYSVFPKFKGIRYIQRTRYRHALKIIATGKHKKYFVSGELDNRLFENYIHDFAAKFPEAKTIIVPRRHDHWIASQYKRYVKNEYAWSFNEFFDLAEDNGYWKQNDLYYFPQIIILERYFKHKPFVLFYEDLKDDPQKFIRKIGSFIGVDYATGNIDFSSRHRSYNDKQLSAVMAVSSRINIQRKQTVKNKTMRVIRGLLPNLIHHSTLYFALILPDSLFTNEELIPPGILESVRIKYSDDWKQCQDYAHRHNP